VKKNLIALLASVLLIASTAAGAQTQEATATTTATTPVFASADDTQIPLRVARENSVLRLLEVSGDWCRIEFQDPDLGRRVGFVRTRQVRIDNGGSTSGVQSQRPTDQISSPPSSTPGGAVPHSEQGDFQTPKSASTGFFVGVTYDGTAIVPTDNGISSATESGPGGSVVLGYGFTPRWSLYGVLSGASIASVDFDGRYGLGHFDIGTRVHFLAGDHRVVPFLQVGLAGRAVSEDFVIGTRTYSVTASGAGVEFGGGLNAHFTRGFAFSGGVTWMVGNFSTYKINDQNVGGSSVGATSARVQLGLIWFPRPHAAVQIP